MFPTILQVRIHWIINGNNKVTLGKWLGKLVLISLCKGHCDSSNLDFEDSWLVRWVLNDPKWSWGAHWLFPGSWEGFGPWNLDSWLFRCSKYEFGKRSVLFRSCFGHVSVNHANKEPTNLLLEILSIIDHQVSLQSYQFTSQCHWYHSFSFTVVRGQHWLPSRAVPQLSLFAVPQACFA